MAYRMPMMLSRFSRKTGHPRVAGPHDEIDHLVHRVLGIDRLDPDPRNHDLVDPRVAQLDDPVDHLLLGFLDLALLGAGLHQELQLLDREQPGLGPLAPTEQAHEQAADRRGQPDERREDARDDRQGPRRDEREALGEVQGQGLGDQLTDDDRGQRDEQGDQDEGDAVGRVLERLPRDGAQRPGDGVAERDRADGRGQEAQERDHQAHRGQEALRVVDQAARHLRAPVPLVGQLLEPMAAHGEQGDLGRREHATDQDQDQDQEQVEPRIPGAGAAFRHPEGLPRPVRPRGFGAARWAAPECRPPSCPGPRRGSRRCPPRSWLPPRW